MYIHRMYIHRMYIHMYTHEIIWMCLKSENSGRYHQVASMHQTWAPWKGLPPKPRVVGLPQVGLGAQHRLDRLDRTLGVVDVSNEQFLSNWLVIY